MIKICISVTSHALDPPPPCHKLSHLLGSPPSSSVTYFMDGPLDDDINSQAFIKAAISCRCCRTIFACGFKDGVCDFRQKLAKETATAPHSWSGFLKIGESELPCTRSAWSLTNATSMGNNCGSRIIVSLCQLLRWQL